MTYECWTLPVRLVRHPVTRAAFERFIDAQSDWAIFCRCKTAPGFLAAIRAGELAASSAEVRLTEFLAEGPEIGGYWDMTPVHPLSPRAIWIGWWRGKEAVTEATPQGVADWRRRLVELLAALGRHAPSWPAYCDRGFYYVADGHLLEGWGP